MPLKGSNGARTIWLTVSCWIGRRHDRTQVPHATALALHLSPGKFTAEPVWYGAVWYGGRGAGWRMGCTRWIPTIASLPLLSQTPRTWNHTDVIILPITHLCLYQRSPPASLALSCFRYIPLDAWCLIHHMFARRSPCESLRCCIAVPAKDL